MNPTIAALVSPQSDDQRYNELAPATKSTITPAQWAWLSDTQKANYQTELCTPDV